MMTKNGEEGTSAERVLNDEATRSTELEARLAIHGSFFRISSSLRRFSGDDKAI